MHEATEAGWMTAERERRLSAEIERQGPRLRSFIRRRVANDADVEDILQDVFSELVEAYGLVQSVEHISAWLFTVARNRITDFFRKRKTETLDEMPVADGDELEMLGIDQLLPSPEAGPDAAYARALLLDELDAALGELPPEQQDVFIAHEIEGKSFKELAAETGVGVNTLLSRKHYAVRYLRGRLQAIHDEFDET
ncbi:MAG TPA: RNA polymerase sigma factor [Gammaproteobacteria bacterium]|nr:RNA polymerase sigma factor [Gammaproteobacteria bacterium]